MRLKLNYSDSYNHFRCKVINRAQTLGRMLTFIGKIKNEAKDRETRDCKRLHAFIGEVFNLWVW